MKTILYMAITANGMIARKDDITPWNEPELDEYVGKVKECGNLIIGRRTYEKMLHDTDKDADQNLLGNPTIIVLTSSKEFKNYDKFVFVDSAEAALKVLAEKNFKTAMIAGGSKINSLFVKNSLIDEIYLDIEPFLFGEGFPLFDPSNFEHKLKLLDTKKVGESGIQLHYEVI